MDSSCVVCLKPKATHSCKSCASPVCKKCARFIDEDQFSFFRHTPQIVQPGAFCEACYTQKLEPIANKYDEIMARAKEVYIFDDTQGKESRGFSRLEPLLQVNDCEDRNETILRLAFWAAEAGFNGLVDVSVSSVKVRNHAFQYLKWKGQGIPTHIDPRKLDKNKSFL